MIVPVGMSRTCKLPAGSLQVVLGALSLNACRAGDPSELGTGSRLAVCDLH